MESHCKGLDKDTISSSSLDGKLHIWTQNPIYYFVASIDFDLTTILYSKIYSSIDGISDDILTGGILDMGNLY